MDGAWLHRARWRYRGAWMWPAFVVLGFADGLIGHALPINSPGQGVFAGLVVGLLLNLLCVVLLSRPVGALLRRLRPDLPVLIARNYAGTACVLLVTVGFVAVGLAQRATIAADRNAMRDAVTRAAAYIGARAPAQFRVNATHLDTFTIEPGSVYRTCVFNRDGSRTYCVIVREKLPLAQSVIPAGYEPNSMFSLGLN